MKNCFLLIIVASTLILGCSSESEKDPKQSALKHIEVALEHVDDISVPGDAFMTNTFRIVIQTRLRQAREYLETDDYANAVERLELVRSDALDPIATGGGTVADRCRWAIDLIQSLR